MKIFGGRTIFQGRSRAGNVSEPPSRNERNQAELGQAELDQLLGEFRRNVHAWSEREFTRPRMVPPAARFAGALVALRWAGACGLLLVVGSVPVYRMREKQAADERQRIQQIAQQRDAETRQRAAALVAKDEQEDFLSDVDSDVSQQTPSAMEPLASLMNESTGSGSSSRQSRQ